MVFSSIELSKLAKMGNTPIVDLMYKRIELEKNRAQLPIPEFFKLIDDKGGGILVLLAKEALASGDTTRLDKAIKDTLPDYLYHNGKGEQVNYL